MGKGIVGKLKDNNMLIYLYIDTYNLTLPVYL